MDKIVEILETWKFDLINEAEDHTGCYNAASSEYIKDQILAALEEPTIEERRKAVMEYKFADTEESE